MESKLNEVHSVPFITGMLNLNVAGTAAARSRQLRIPLNNCR